MFRFLSLLFQFSVDERERESLLGRNGANYRIQEAIGISMRIGAREPEATAHERVAHFLIMTGRFDEARQSSETSIEIFKDFTLVFGVV